MYDYDKCCAAWKRFVLDYEPDGHMGCTAPGPGRFFEILDYKLYAWPGHGVAPEHPYQCLEGEYMKAGEYDALIQDPSGFFSNAYLPRVFGALGGFQKLPFLPGILEMYGVAFNFTPYGLPLFKPLSRPSWKPEGKPRNGPEPWGALIVKWHH